MISLIRGNLCGSAHRDRKLNTGCQGLEGRIMKNYSLMDLEFQFWEMKTSGNVLDNVTAVNPTEVSTSNGCDGKFYVCVFYHILKKITHYLSSHRYTPKYLICNPLRFLLPVYMCLQVFTQAHAWAHVHIHRHTSTTLIDGFTVLEAQRMVQIMWPGLCLQEQTIAMKPGCMAVVR